MRGINNFELKKALLLFILMMIPPCTSAGIFDDIEKIKGMVVIQAGDAKKVACPWE